MASLINRSACKKAVLELAARERAKKFTRVGSDVLDYLDSVLVNTITRMII